MSELFAACTPNSHPNDEGQVEHGYSLTILDQDMAVVTSMNLPDWRGFHEHAATKHLEDMGFTLKSNPRAPEEDGWTPVALGQMVSVERVNNSQSASSS